MRKKERNFRWKHAALAVMLGTVFCFTGCGSKDDNPAEETVKAETTKDDSAKDNTAQQETPDSTETAKAENTPTEAPESTPTETPATPTPKPGIEFPYVVDEDGLQAEAVFQLGGVNPDCQDEMCENAGALQVKNVSDKYLESADIKAVLTDGAEFNFHVEDVPAGETVLAFDTENKEYDGKTNVKTMEAETTYSADASLKEEALNITVEEDGIHVENISGSDIGNLTVKYHCMFDDAYYGGISYEKTVETLGADETVVLDASECYIGEVAVVNVLY